MNIFCEQKTPAYVQIDCGIDQAGIVAAGFIDPNVPTPTKTQLESVGYWNSLLQASPPNIFIATKTRGEYPGGTATEEDGFGKESTQVTGATHEATIESEGIDENRLFYEAVNSKKWKMVYITNGGKGIYVDTPGTPYFKLNVPRGITTAAFWMGTVKWQSFANPVVFDAPTGIFDE